MGNKNNTGIHTESNKNDTGSHTESNKNNSIITVPVQCHLPSKVDPFHENTSIRFDALTNQPLSTKRHDQFRNDDATIHNINVLVSNFNHMDIIKHAVKQLNQQLNPAVYKLHKILSLGDLDLNDPIKPQKDPSVFAKGIHFSCVIVPYNHNPRSPINCEHLLKSNNKLDPMNCPIYQLMQKHYFFTEENLYHLVYNTHFVDEYEQKPRCTFGEECKAYIRLKEGKDRLDDRCHVKIYRHPPRRRNIKLQQDMYAFLMAELKDGAKHFDKEKRPKLDDLGIVEDYKSNNDLADVILKMLIDEVVANGFEKDLCKDDVKAEQNTDYYIMRVVKDKLNHQRHKRIGSPLYECHMLALILYTGCDCNADLCVSQRCGDYAKWKVFDYCLHHAIRILDHYEAGDYRVYSGVCAVKLNKTRVGGYFVTYTSTTWKKEIAQQFTGCEGMILEMDNSFRSNCICCDVSWISHFDECEILVSRCPKNEYHEYYGGDMDYGVQHEMLFQCSVIDESNGIQTVSLNLSQNTETYYD